jgi:hypothetical protein
MLSDGQTLAELEAEARTVAQRLRQYCGYVCTVPRCTVHNKVCWFQHGQKRGKPSGERIQYHRRHSIKYIINVQSTLFPLSLCLIHIVVSQVVPKEVLLSTLYGERGWMGAHPPPDVSFYSNGKYWGESLLVCRCKH